MSKQGFFGLLEQRVFEIDSLLCIGLDPHLPQLLEPNASSAEKFCKDIIDATIPYAAAYKPNIAFFEALGEDGMIALKNVISSIPANIPVILDCKRGDIDTTAHAYAQAAYDVLGAGAVTLSPYMGWDSIKPFVTEKYHNKGAFILCKTSNPSSKEMQELVLQSNQTIYQQVAKMSLDWNKSCDHPCIGLVGGATDILALKSIRMIAPDAWILCPGVGAQGGYAMSVCAAGLRDDGSGLLVSVSRAISSASDKLKAAITLRDEINTCRHAILSASSATSFSVSNLHPYQREFIDFALTNNVLKFGSYTLKSGRTSPYFFNAGMFNSGMSMSLLGRFYAQAIHSAGVEFDVIFGPAYKGIPLATAVSIAWYTLYGENKDMAYNRKEAKDHGEGGTLVGASMTGRRVLIVDDVITAGTAIRESVELLNHIGAMLVGVVVSLDRQEKIAENASESAIQTVERTLSIPVISIIKLKNLISYLQQSTAGLTLTSYLPAIELYREQYGVDY